MTILITGAAGFIGSHVAEAYLNQGKSVIGLDNLNDFYDPEIKKENISQLKKYDMFKFVEGDILDENVIDELFSKTKISLLVHLAAMAGVRPSISQSSYYTDVNIKGTVNLLEACKKYQVKKILFASSSSVYGNNKKVPFSEEDVVDYPVSPYAATKKAGELICHTYSHLYDLSIACLRFFTVYGPKQRPEMAIHLFTDAIQKGRPISVFNEGHCLRDYTYIDDIVQGMLSIAKNDFKFDVINLGESETISTLDMIRLIEKELGKKAQLNLLPAQPGDVDQTFADISRAKQIYDYQPKVSIQDGIKRFVAWYLAKLE